MLLLGKRIVHGRALIDPGSTGDFINSKFTSLHSLSLTPRSHPMTCTAFDGSPSVGGPVTHQWHGRLAMSAVEDQLFESPVSLNVSLLGDYDLILGMPWLRAHSGWVGAAGPSLLLLGPSSPSASFSIAVVDATVAASTASQVPITPPSSSLPSRWLISLMSLYPVLRGLYLLIVRVLIVKLSLSPILFLLTVTLTFF